MDIGQVSKQLNSRAESVAAMLLPNGKKRGYEWVAGDIRGDSGDSLSVRLSGEKAGVWSDFSEGIGGDLLDLWAAVKGISLVQAFSEAKDYLGITEPRFDKPVKISYRKPVPPKGARVVKQNTPVMEYLTQERKLLPEFIAAYRIGEYENPRKGWEIVFPYKRDNELLAVKYLALERTPDGKKQMRSESGCEQILFGWQAISDSARSVVICEGELDAVSWYQAGYPALSVPNGCQSDKWIETEFEQLARFDTIYLSYDMDKAGQSYLQTIAERLGLHRARLVRLPHKDANECLQVGTAQDVFDSAIAQAQTLDPAELKNAGSFADEVIELFYPAGGVEPGFVTPFLKLIDKVRFRPGELSVWAGYNGHGKSMLLSQTILAGAEQRERFVVAPTEMRPARWLQRLTQQAAARRFPSEPHIRLVHQSIAEWLWLYNVPGVNKPKRLLEVFDYAWRRYGITQFIIDSLSKLGFADDDYNGQKLFAEEFADFALRTNTHAHLVTHARKGANEREPVGKLDVKGSGGITDMASNVFSVWRNKVKEDAVMLAEAQDESVSEEVLMQPDALFICDKQRNGEWEKRLPLWYDRDSLQYRDDIYGRLVEYVSERPLATNEPPANDADLAVNIEEWLS